MRLTERAHVSASVFRPADRPSALCALPLGSLRTRLRSMTASNSANMQYALFDGVPPDDSSINSLRNQLGAWARRQFCMGDARSYCYLYVYDLLRTASTGQEEDVGPRGRDLSRRRASPLLGRPSSRSPQHFCDPTDRRRQAHSQRLASQLSQLV